MRIALLIHHFRTLLIVFAIIVLCIGVFSTKMVLAGSPGEVSIKAAKLLEKTTTISDHPVVFLQSVELPPGGTAGPHRHTGPVFGYVLEGTLYTEVEGRNPITLEEGQAFDEPAGIHCLAHNPRQSKPTKLIVIEICREGEAPTIYLESKTKIPAILQPKVTTLMQKTTYAPQRPLVDVIRIELPPGVGSPPHRHSGQAFGYVASGELIIQEQGSELMTLKEGQVYYVKSMVPHLLAYNPSIVKPTVLIAFGIGISGEPSTLP